MKTNHDIPKDLQQLMLSVYTAVWAWQVKLRTRKGEKCKVNWQNAIGDLCIAYSDWSNGIKAPDSPRGEGSERE